MKFFIDRIPESGLELAESCLASRLDLNRPDIKFSQPLEVSARVSKGVNNISVSLRVSGAMEINCGRCLEEFKLPLNRKANLYFPIETRNEIDLTDNIREEVIISYPLKPLCRPDCRGLCPRCGQNLNQRKCQCQTKGADNGFTQKASFKDQTGFKKDTR